MSPGTILIVGETRSLSDALAALLEADGLPVLQVPDWPRALEAGRRAEAGIAALLLASNQPRSPSLEEWPSSELADRHLIWVGMRGGSPPTLERLHTVTLPLNPRELLALVRSVVGARPPTVAAGGPETPGGRTALHPPMEFDDDRTVPADRPEESGDPNSSSLRNPFVRVVS